MALPDTFPELAEAGYRYLGQGRCSRCGATLEWFLTKKNRRMPMSAKSETRVGQDVIYEVPSITRLEPHWASCPNASDFRRRRR